MATGSYDVVVIGAGPAGEQAADGTVRRLSAARAVVLATRTRPVVPPIPGLAEVGPWDNRAATSAKELPGRLVVLGGGAVEPSFPTVSEVWLHLLEAYGL